MINQFKYKFSFLSNFYECSVIYEDIFYKSSEAAFQAAKTLDRKMKGVFSDLSPDHAKYLGRRIDLRPDWEEVKDQVMYEIVKAKFIQNEDLGRQLLETGDEELVEGTLWHDIYWGIDLSTGKGQNKLGQILMRVRSELREEVSSEDDALEDDTLYALYNRPGAGFDSDKKNCQSLLTLNTYYEVSVIRVGDWLTDVYLEDFPNKCFNSVNFTFYKKDKKGNFIIHNIMKDPEYNPYL